MFLLLFLLSFLASAQDCKMYGSQNETGSWVFYPTEMPGTIEVPLEAIEERCSVAWEILEMKNKKIQVSNEKKLAKKVRTDAEKVEQDRIKFLKDKIKTEKLTQDEKDELLKALVEGK